MIKNISLLQFILVRDEGKVKKVYVDTLGYKIAGIGHLLVGAEKNLEVGAPIPTEQIQDWFDKDVDDSIATALRYVPELYQIDEVRQIVIVSLAFNLFIRPCEVITFPLVCHRIGEEENFKVHRAGSIGKWRAACGTSKRLQGAV